jgi:trans-aconitate 2-methyltransferase
MDWNPRQYEKFIGPREAPFADLLARIDKRPRMRVVDLGCGPGNITRKLADALPEAEVLAIDSSPAMLARAAETARPGLRYAERTIEDWVAEEGAAFDLVFSNAALHWTADHAVLLPRILGRLAAGGQVAVQLPADDYNPMRAVFADVAGWRHHMGTLDIAAYAELLYRAGIGELDVFEKIYPHLLPDADAVLEWAKGSALLPYLERLPPAQHAPYLDEVRRRLQVCYPDRPVFFPFRRVLFYGRRA